MSSPSPQRTARAPSPPSEEEHFRMLPAPNGAPKMPAPLKLLPDTGCELLLPPNKTVDWREWKTADLVAWIEKFCPASEYPILQTRMVEEQVDGFMVPDSAMADIELHELFRIALGPWLKLRNHATVVWNAYLVEKHKREMAEYEEKMRKFEMGPQDGMN